MSFSTGKIVGVIIAAALLVTVGYGVFYDSADEKDSLYATYNVMSAGSLDDYIFLQPIFITDDEYDVTVMESGQCTIKDIKKVGKEYNSTQILDVSTTFILKENIPVSAVTDLNGYEFVEEIDTDVIYMDGNAPYEWVKNSENTVSKIYSSSNEKLEYDNISFIKNVLFGENFSAVCVSSHGGYVDGITCEEDITLETTTPGSPIIYDVKGEPISTGLNYALGFFVKVSIYESVDKISYIVEDNTGFIMGQSFATDASYVKYTIKSTSFEPFSNVSYKDPVRTTIDYEHSIIPGTMLHNLIFGQSYDNPAVGIITGIETEYAIDSKILDGTISCYNISIAINNISGITLTDIFSQGFRGISIMHSGNISSLYGDFNMFIGTDSVVNLFFTDKTVACLQINNADGSDVKIVYMADNDGNITGITVFLKTVCDVTA